MDQDWYYGRGDDNIGPLPFDELIAALRSTPNWRSVQVWCSDFDDWRRAGDVRQIALRLAVAQAPPPPAPKPATKPASRPSAARPQQPAMAESRQGQRSPIEAA